jgi:hypothetical protein
LPIISALRRLRQENPELEASLGNIERPYLRKRKKHGQEMWLKWQNTCLAPSSNHNTANQTLVAHIYNPSYSGGRVQVIAV